jgi:hypothetical protein
MEPKIAMVWDDQDYTFTTAKKIAPRQLFSAPFPATIRKTA